MPTPKSRVWRISKRAKTSERKKILMADNLQPKHFPKRQTTTSKIYVCRFGGEGTDLASFKSPESIV